MSSLLGSIFSKLGNLFGNFIPSWGSDTPLDEDQETTPPTESHDVNQGNDGIEDSDTSSEYDTAPISSTRWYSASRSFLCYREHSKSNEVEFFDGITHWIGSKNDFSELSRDCFFIKVDKNETLEEAHKRYTNESIAISHKSNGFIDMRKSGTYAATSLRLFQDVTKGPISSKRLTQEEEHWISKASTGSIIWAEAYEGNARQYDVNEFYPSLLLQKDAQWPIGTGQFKLFTKLNDKLQYGIYRVHIEGLPNKSAAQCSKLFRYNQEEYYTHYDIDIARKNGLEVKLINVSPNAYIFSQENLMDGKLLFEDWANKLTSIKRENAIKAYQQRNNKEHSCSNIICGQCSSTL